MWRVIERDGVAEASHRYSVSAPICKRLSERYRVPFEDLPNVQALVEDVRSDGRLRRAIGAEQAEPVAIYVGRVTGGRGLELVVPAASKRQDIHWVIMGPPADGPYGASIVHDATSAGVRNVHVLAPVPSAEVGVWLKEATVAFVPTTSTTASYQLGLGNKSFHALSVGLPQVLSDQPGKRAFAQDTGAAVTFEPGSDAALAETVGRLVDDSETHARLSEAATVSARRYDWRVLGADYRDRCLSLMDHDT